MGKITNDLVEFSFEIGKKVYKNELSLKEGIQTLTQKGMNRNSANDYIYNYSNLIQGKLFTRTSNIYATEYFLERIYRENGLSGLQNALLSLSQHIEYYEEKSGAKVKSIRKIYNKYL